MLGAIALAISAMAHAIEFRSVSDEIALLYDAPSKDATRRLILTRGYPVEVIIEAGDWVRVRDEVGTFGWIESRRLAAKRTVMVSEGLALVHESPSASAPVVFKAEKGVFLDFMQVTGGWAKVRHRTGIVGFVRLSQLWGV
ncbi:MAG: SH3 domain-containing protein [Burkholderiales bacterium]